MRFFQQRFQLIVQPYFVTPELVFCARHGPPETLFGMGQTGNTVAPEELWCSTSV